MFKKAFALMSILLLIAIYPAYSQSFVKTFSGIYSFAKLGNTTIVAASGDASQAAGIWKTDGTPAGTTLVKAFTAGTNAPLFVYNNKAYFAGSDAINGQELWQTDGTAAGTVLVKDINTAHVGNTGSQPSQFTYFKGLLYFTATEDGNYYSIWKTDGTTAGTTRVTDPLYAGYLQMTVVGNTLYYTIGTYQLWKTDGTPAGTSQITVDDYNSFQQLKNINNQLVFVTNGTYYNDRLRLYRLDPANNTPVLLHAYNPVAYDEMNDALYITAVGSKFFFSIHTNDNNGTDALWVSDGTPAGTVQLKTFAWQSSMSGSFMQDFVAFNNKLYFAGTTDHKLWTSDGTAAGTIKVADVGLSTDITPVISDQKLYFNGNGVLWRFDGTTAAAELQQPAGPGMLYDVNGKLYFTTKTQFTAALWTNAPASQLLVTANYQTLTTGSTSTFTSKADSSVTVPVVVKNTGNKDFLFGEISVTGNSFYVNGTPAQTIQAGKQVNFNLIYSPGKEESVKGTLIIKSNDNSGQANFTANLIGNATGTAVKKNNIPAGGLQKSISFKDTIPDFTLNQNTISENAAVNTVIGSFKANVPANTVFQLTAGTGDTDNGSFKIENGQLKSLTALNFNIKSTYTIRVKGGNTATSPEKQFVIQVTNVQTNLATASCGPGFQNINYSLNDVAYAGSRIVAVGTAGKIIISDDNGQQWKAINSGINTDFSKVQFPDSQTGYIVGSNSVLFKTENGGSSWFPLPSPAPSYPGLINLAFPSVTVGYLVGGDGVYKTADGGRNWKKCYDGFYNNLNSAYFLDENNGFICGSSQTLIHTTDGGKTWETIAIPALGFNTNLSAITFVNSKTGYMTSNAGDVLQSKDGGKTWARISTVATDGVTSRILFSNESTGYIAAGFNLEGLYKTTDGGQTWKPEGTNGFGALLGLAVNKTGDKVCAVGHGVGLGYTSEQGSLILLKNGSANWEERSRNGNDDYFGGNMFASGTGYVLGTRSFKTTDGGITWRDMHITYDSNLGYFHPIKGYFLNENTGFYADFYSVYKTTNGGTSWAKVNTDSTSQVRFFYFYNAQIGYYANNYFVFRTADGGNTWTKVLPTYNSYSISSISFPDAQTGYATGIGSTVYKSTDGGLTWTSKDFGNDKGFASIGFFDAKTGMAGGIGGTLYRTTDGGDTWSPVYTSMYYATVAFQFLDKTHAYLLNNYYGGSVNEIYETRDAGLTWNRIYQTWTDIWGFNVNDGQLFLPGGSGSMLKYSSTGAQPANAGYIAGDTTIVALNKVNYTVPAVNGTYYKWAASGDASIEYQNNTAIIAWKKGGQYSLQVTPYNSCGTGESRLLNIGVEDMPEPEFTGPDTVLNRATNVIYTATVHDNNTYSWTATNSTGVIPAANKTGVNWGDAGIGTVTVAEYNPRLNLKKSAIKNVIIKKGAFTLPDNNFTVLINAATCKGSNNGAITIKTIQKLSYQAVVTGPGNFNKTYAFTDSLKVGSLAPGAYNACLTVTGNPDFQRCYVANIAEPKDLSLYTAVNLSTHILTLNLSGADSYNIELNDKHYQTSSTQLELPLNAGANQLKVYSDKLCQGIIQKIVNLNKITIYPNPFVDNIKIDVGGSPEANRKVEISNAFGKVLYSQVPPNDGDQISINTATLSKGIYVLKLTLGQTNSVFKIVKQ